VEADVIQNKDLGGSQPRSTLSLWGDVFDDGDKIKVFGDPFTHHSIESQPHTLGGKFHRPRNQ